ncbi:hypothetical protein BC939DRAFT_506662 [Gamsiella multidivaricata]|uniref:uncharacterized protein n=1 Tax=Gamsiella multidivaricata TaxID=101098 RepID=UPI0022209D7D|nr:uncharacterized protein BC939DRAFT_506662 [Gamsiella multidivaricata]KAG0357905.1 hypothetical protein BGZ54_000131 [Gamsiella multidivaricata]KAI7818266.1 hypothetical protein BC939DRAFT_506662 [Gamsiella multidivaricata]
MRKSFLRSTLANATGTSPKPFQTTLTSTRSWPFTADRPASTTRPVRIAVLDSSFNPPTKAHYHLLKAAARAGCDAVLLLLATNNVDKGQTNAGAVERLEMMEAMAMDSIHNEKEDPALRRMAVGLTIHARFMDKAQPILDYYPPNTVQLSWIMGHDTMTRLFDPKYYKDVHTDMAPFFERCDVICSSRPGYGSREEMMRFVEQSGYVDKVTLVDIVAEEEEEEVEGDAKRNKKDGGIEIKEMSSTVVRNAVKTQDRKLVERCVLPSVRRLIESNGLYSDLKSLG